MKIAIPLQKFTTILIMLLALSVIIIHADSFITPLYLAILITMLLIPVANFFEHRKINRPLAALLSLVLALLFVSLIVFLLTSQVVSFFDDLPAIKENLQEKLNTVKIWLEHTLNIQVNTKEAGQTVNKNIENNGFAFIRTTVVTVSELIGFIIIVAVYIFFMLSSRHIVKNFLLALFKKNQEMVKKVADNTQKILRQYLSGLLIEMLIVGVANTTLFSVIGIKYAIFLGILTAILNILPYIGIYSGIVITVLVSLTTDASVLQIVWIVAGMIIIHFFDSNILMTKIVGSKVKINALTTVLGATIGGFLMGIPGIFFAMPTLAMLKVIFEETNTMQPWVVLMSVDEENKKNSMQDDSKRIKKEEIPD